MSKIAMIGSIHANGCSILEKKDHILETLTRKKGS